MESNPEEGGIFFRVFLLGKRSGTVRKLEKRGFLMEKNVENIKFSVFTSSYFWKKVFSPLINLKPEN